jgi:opacity protein-like surface antigen
MMSRRVHVMAALTGLLVLSMPAFAQHYSRRYAQNDDGEFRLRAGSFRPEGDSEYWKGIQNDFTNSETSDFEGPDFGLDFLLPLNDRMSLMFSGSYFEGTTTGSYRNFEDNLNNRIRHDTTLDVGSATIGLVFHLLPRGSSIQPYIGAGGGAFPYRLQERGDFIGSGAGNPIFSDRLTSSGTAFGYYGVVGLEAPITRSVSIFAEGRWTRAKADLKDDFEGFGKLDLGGREISAGLSWSL